jgi:uncharacterized protein (TIGR03032 family)
LSLPKTVDSERFQPANFVHSSAFPELIADLGCSLLVSTYQAGQLCTIGSTTSGLHVALEPFPSVMGIAVHPRRIAIGCKGVIWTLQNAGKELANQVAPAGAYDAVLAARSAHLTGNVQLHEMGFAGEDLWIVNTLFSCLAKIEPDFSFVPQWKPKFVSNCYAPGDRCHLNGLAMDPSGPRLVTALASTDEPNGWRANKETTGVLIDVPSQEIVCQGFAMPHSPRIHQGKTYLLDSGRGQLVVVSPKTGTWDVVSAFPGYTRGLAFLGNYAFVGLSRMRETSVFGGVPLSRHKDQLQCGVGIVDLTNGRQLAAFQFTSGIHEIFDVQVLPGVRNPVVWGPVKGDDAQERWVTPPPPSHLQPQVQPRT